MSNSAQSGNIIVMVFAGIGIVGGILARRAIGIDGVIPGALFGGGGAVLGMLIGIGITKAMGGGQQS